MSNMVLRDTNELPWPRGFQIGVTLDAFFKFLKSGVLMGHSVLCALYSVLCTLYSVLCTLYSVLGLKISSFTG